MIQSAVVAKEKETKSNILAAAGVDEGVEDNEVGWMRMIFNETLEDIIAVANYASR